MIRLPALHPAGPGRPPGHAAGPVSRQEPPTVGWLAGICAAAWLVPPWFTGLAVIEATLALGAGIVGTLIVLSLPTYLAFFFAGRSLLRRQSTGEDTLRAWTSLKWDLAGGAVLLNLSFLDYYTLGSGLFEIPIQLAVIALTNLVVFLIGAGLVEFVRGQLLRRRK